MAIIGNINQQPSDNLDYDIDCTDLIGSGDTVASVTVASTSADLSVLAVVAATADAVKVWITGGISGVTYKVTVTVTTTLGRVKQDELKVKIKEV